MPETRALPTASASAQLAESTGARWQDPTFEAKPGARLPAGATHLITGLVEIQFDDGARVRIEGPAEFAAQSGRRMELSQGRIAAYVPPRARGFTIVTPTAEVVDLGTEFGLEVGSDGNTEVQVVRGIVSVTAVETKNRAQPAKTTSTPIRLRGGQALTVGRTQAGAVVAEAVPFDAARVEEFGRPIKPAARRSEKVQVCWAQPDGLAGNQADFRGGLGFDFKVMQPIRVFRLGVFDHLGDGIAPDSSMTVQLWTRDGLETASTADDIGGRVLAEANFTANAPGELRYCYRFVPLAELLDLAPGDYSLLAYGFSEVNQLVNLGYPISEGASRSTHIVLRSCLEGSRFLDRISAGTFPSDTRPRQVLFGACSFEFMPISEK